MNKKFLSPKVLTIGGLCLLCAAILVGVLYWKSTPVPTFTPEADTSVKANSEWEAPASAPPSVTNPKANDESQPAEDAGDPVKDTYQTVSESEDGAVINMTPPAEKPEPPEAPEGKKVAEDNAVPSTPPSSGACVTPPPEGNKQKPSDSKPGQVYDPVFGWTDVASAVGEEADSDGDINKMVGSMD